jgi:Cu2+-exporting ATPase
MSISTISVTDMHCSACAAKIRQALQPLNGIQATYVNPVRRQVLVEHGRETDPLDILTHIESAGFTPTLSSLDDHDARQKSLLKRLGVAGLAMMQVMMASIALYAGAFDGMDIAYQRLFQFTGLIFTIPVVCYSAVPFFSSALRGFGRAGTGMSMDVPIALAIAIAFLTSLHATLTGTGEVYFDSVVMFTFLLLGARYIDNRLQHRFDMSSQLLTALPRTALVLEDGRRTSVPIADLAVGTHIWIPEGAQVPVDGLNGSNPASIDEAILTGESEWVRKQAGDRLFAGSFNRSAGFEMTSTHAVDESRIADIARLADSARMEGSDITRLTDRIAAVFVPSIITLAVAAWVGWQLVEPSKALTAALTVLVVSCPCALSLATPAALTAAMTRLRQLGIVLTSSSALEKIPLINRLFIDKTGTLTVSEPVIQKVELLDSTLSKDTCCAIAAGLQQHSSHPYARAFHGMSERASVERVETVAGLGVEGYFEEKSVRIGSAAFTNIGSDGELGLFLSIDGRPAARFELSDRLRPDAEQSVAALKALGVAPLMMSGDSFDRCAEVASALEIEFEARRSPEDKLASIRSEQTMGNRILMLGDGINDVPVLAGADVSVAVAEASDLVKSEADVLLLSRRLFPLVDLIRIGRATRNVVRQNLLWAALYNLTAIPLAALGFMPPWLAAVGMASSSILVMLNATRLMSAGGTRQKEAG